MTTVRHFGLAYDWTPIVAGKFDEMIDKTTHQIFRYLTFFPLSNSPNIPTKHPKKSNSSLKRRFPRVRSNCNKPRATSPWLVIFSLTRMHLVCFLDPSHMHMHDMLYTACVYRSADTNYTSGKLYKWTKMSNCANNVRLLKVKYFLLIWKSVLRFLNQVRSGVSLEVLREVRNIATCPTNSSHEVYSGTSRSDLSQNSNQFKPVGLVTATRFCGKTDLFTVPAIATCCRDQA